MVSADDPGQILVVSSSDQESDSSKLKRSGSSFKPINSRDAKRRRFSPQPTNLQVSEEGEVQSSGDQSKASTSGDQSKASASGRVKSSPASNIKDHMSDDKVSQSGAIMPDSPSCWTSKQGISFKLPVFTGPPRGSWPSRFTKWIHVFFTNNLTSSSDITSTLSLAAFEHYLDKLSGLKTGGKKKSKQAARQSHQSGKLKSQLDLLRKEYADNPQTVAEDQTAHKVVKGTKTTEARRVEPATEAATTAASPALKATTTRPSAPTGSQEYAQQLKYYPSASDPSKMCILCSREGHIAVACPDLACRFCGDEGHWAFCCSTKIRCASCLKLGHDAESCIYGNKTQTSVEENLPCAFCDSRTHADNECPEACRSYRPEADTIKKVRQLPVSCAICASRDHSLYDCSQRLTPAMAVWSRDHYMQYIDPECGVLAIEAAHSHDEERKGRQNIRGFRVPGRASRPNKVKYISSDYESDDQCSLFNSAAGTSNAPPRGPIAPKSWASAAGPQGPSQGHTPIRFNLQMRGARSSDHPASRPQPGGTTQNWDSNSTSGRGAHGGRGGRGGRGRSRGRSRGRGRGLAQS